jgi:4-hydroxy-tetrahydrodipicolinate reductase
MLRLAVSGAGGRMGRRIVALAGEERAFKLVGALEAAGHSLLGQDIGPLVGVGELGVKLAEHLSAPADVMIDFSSPAGAVTRAAYCAEHKLPLVVGTTGLGEVEKQALRRAAEKTAVLLGANMSLGVNLLFKLAAEVAGKLDESYDIEIVETHHRFKKDAPSGTALELARQVAGAKAWAFPACLTHGREGKEALRQPKTIGMHAVRAGDTVGEHSVLFAALGETIELKHSAHTRDNFARGALKAAQWLAGKPAGFYSMFDVLGL